MVNLLTVGTFQVLNFLGDIVALLASVFIVFFTDDGLSHFFAMLFIVFSDSLSLLLNVKVRHHLDVLNLNLLRTDGHVLHTLDEIEGDITPL